MVKVIISKMDGSSVELEMEGIENITDLKNNLAKSLDEGGFGVAVDQQKILFDTQSLEDSTLISNIMPQIHNTESAINLTLYIRSPEVAAALIRVKQDFFALQFASNVLRDDREFVLDLVKQDGGSLYFASEELRADKEIVLEAVKQDGNALRFTKNETKNQIERDFETWQQKDGDAQKTISQFAEFELSEKPKNVVKQILPNVISCLRRSR